MAVRAAMLLGAEGAISAHLAADILLLAEPPRDYERLRNKTDGCVRAVLRPGG
ncbi:hypothetical protein [Streptomyces sp. ME19-01-6]|uniref:hypothetical protein n=1 Tax=Streptomyces sp. ME19-01-6 TaxID=3028686 RepID=UPI00299FF7FA|nr:hypothetical protein [Streptomyces sp. ME19-01-6]MDX3231719.1 hypothetical protein [Streptomyces sp. ME19-01-6]